MPQVESTQRKKKRLSCRQVIFIAVAFVIGEVLVASKINTNRWWEGTQDASDPLFGNTKTNDSNNFGNITRFQLRDTSIRRWGCGLTDTPLIFVHIGKAGGGAVRARLAAASLNFSHNIPWHDNHQAYYPVRISGDKGMQQARFCNGEYHNYRPRIREKNFESTFQCYATTPLGMAISCPELFHARLQKDQSNNPCPYDPTSETAHVVYVGHNYFGFEMHWLPEPYLSKWWKAHWADEDDPITPLLKTLNPKLLSWCDGRRRGIFAKRQTIDFQVECGKKMQHSIDQSATKVVAAKLGSSIHEMVSWAPVYASLPVLRIVVVRDPFSWLVSKFLWHDSGKKYNLTCDDIEAASFGSGHPNPHIGSVLVTASLIDDCGGPGWARRMALGYIHQLCGEDCVARTYNGESTLDALTHQAEANLRQGFAVVGLLNETDRFYMMLNRRIDYLNTSLNMNVRHRKHTSVLRDAKRCRKRFSDPEFQTNLIAASPEVAALHHLFGVAVEVNRFQLSELQKCTD